MLNVKMKTQIYSDENALSILSDVKNKKIFIVCDPFMVESGKIHLLTDVLDKTNTLTIFKDTVPDPTLTVVAKGISEAVRAEASIMIGFGGGSAIDTAKAILYFGQSSHLIQKERFIAIPTTSGTGSEVTSVAVITDTDDQTKKVIKDDSIQPDLAILDAGLVASLPPIVTANTGMDVLTHALEAYVATGASCYSDALAEKAVELLLTHLVECYEKGSRKKARVKVHEAATLAGMAFNTAGLGINHSIAHQLGGVFHIPHGLANAIVLKEVIKFNAKKPEVLCKYAKLVKKLGIVEGRESDAFALQVLLQVIDSLMTCMKMPKKVSQMDISKNDYERQIIYMAQNVLRDWCIGTTPCKINEEQTISILKKIY